MDDIHLSAISYFGNALSVGIQLSPEQIVGKLDALDQREHGDEALDELGYLIVMSISFVPMLTYLKVK